MNMGTINFIKNYNFIVTYINKHYNKKYKIATIFSTIGKLRKQYNKILKFVEKKEKLSLDNTWYDFRNSVSMMHGFLKECEFCKELNLKLYDINKNELQLI